MMKRFYALALLASMTAGIAWVNPAYAQTFSELDRGSFSLFVKIAVKPDTRNEFVTAMKGRVAQSRTVDGVVDFRLLSTSDPSVFALFESFQSKAAFDAFIKTPESAAFLEKLKPYLAAPLDVQMLNQVP